MLQKFRLITVLSLAAALAFSTIVYAQNESKRAAKKSVTQSEEPSEDVSGDQEGQKKREKEPRQLQIFQLKHSKPQDVLQLITMAITSRPAAREEASGEAAEGAEAESPEDVRIAADDESSLLFVRASKKCLDQVKEVVTAFDTPADEVNKKEFSGMLIVPLTNENADRVLGIFQQLDINVSTLSFGEKQLLVIDVQQSETAEQAKQILAAFDGKSKPTKVAEKPETTKNE